MTPEQIADLRAKALRATPGPWTRDKPVIDRDGFRNGVAIAATYGRHMIYANPPGGSSPSNDADFIAAANPKVILELLADHEAAHETIRRYEMCEQKVVNDLSEHLAEIEEAAKPFAETTDFPALSVTCSQADIRALRAALKETGND